MGKPGRAVRAAGWVAVGVVAAGGVATAATSSSGSSNKPASVTATDTASTPAATPAKHPKRGALARLQGRLLHGEATVLGKDGKPVVVAEQRGTVEAVSSTSISVTSKDGFNQTYVVSPTTTRVRVDGKKSSIADVKVGQPAAVVAKVDGSTQSAVIVIERAPKAAPAA